MPVLWKRQVGASLYIALRAASLPERAQRFLIEQSTCPLWSMGFGGEPEVVMAEEILGGKDCKFMKTVNQTPSRLFYFLQSNLIFLPLLLPFHLKHPFSLPESPESVTVSVFSLLSWLSINSCNLTGLRILPDLVMRSQIYPGGSQLMAVSSSKKFTGLLGCACINSCNQTN